MFFIISWILFGLVVGYIAKSLHPGDEPIGYLPTLGIGVAGSFVGGIINFLLGMGNQSFQTSGLIMSVLGGVVCCAGWRYYKLKTSLSGPKSFISGRAKNN
jgi:uncharacterized membrane protein YeaQ/YmgE (transglycosylase-associated protein family)